MSMSKQYFGDGGPAMRPSSARPGATRSAGAAHPGGMAVPGQHAATPARAEQAATTATTAAAVVRYGLASLRILLGFVFLWAFADKTFGWGLATPAENAWLNGGSPTTGYLGGVEGPASGVFNAMAGNVFFDWLFMLGLLGIGLALMLGIGMRIAAATGALLLLLMWVAALPLAVNPFVDSHLTEAILLVVLAAALAGDTLGLGRWWSERSFVRRYPVLR
jgi:thiosulfate dehydrogenase [quinone] large subunit